jgi:hypothetical protein
VTLEQLDCLRGVGQAQIDLRLERQRLDEADLDTIASAIQRTGAGTGPARPARGSRSFRASTYAATLRPGGCMSTAIREIAELPIQVSSRVRSDPRQQRVLQVVQPALAGMMDGSVSTLARLFATALATGNSHTAFLVGMAAAVGAGISMAFAEALSDDESVTGRGNP